MPQFSILCKHSSRYCRESADVPQFRGTSASRGQKYKVLYLRWTRTGFLTTITAEGNSISSRYTLFTFFCLCMRNIRGTIPPPASVLLIYPVQGGFLPRTSILSNVTLLYPCRVQPVGVITGCNTLTSFMTEAAHCTREFAQALKYNDKFKCRG